MAALAGADGVGDDGERGGSVLLGAVLVDDGDGLCDGAFLVMGEVAEGTWRAVDDTGDGGDVIGRGAHRQAGGDRSGQEKVEKDGESHCGLCP